jgi:hypothetical protein
MATFVSAKATDIYWNGYDLAAYFNSATVPKSAETQDTTTFGATAIARVGTLKDGSVSLSGFLDESTAGGAGTILATAIGTDSNEVSVYPTSDVAGEYGHGLVVTESSYEISGAVAGVCESSVEGQSSYSAERLRSYRPLSSASASGTTVGVDNAAASLLGASGYLHVTSLIGGTLTVKYQDSTDDVTYADLLTFTTTSATTFSERKADVGQVDRYARVVTTLNGGTAIFQTGLSRNPHP